MIVLKPLKVPIPARLSASNVYADILGTRDVWMTTQLHLIGETLWTEIESDDEERMTCHVPFNDLKARCTTSTTSSKP